jgi:uncharacterized membrane protein
MTVDNNAISAAGLILDIIGVSIVFFNSLPLKRPVADPSQPSIDFSGNKIEQPFSPDEIQKMKKMRWRMLRIGLPLLFIGFLLQFIAIIMQMQK